MKGEMKSETNQPDTADLGASGGKVHRGKPNRTK